MYHIQLGNVRVYWSLAISPNFTHDTCLPKVIQLRDGLSTSTNRVLLFGNSDHWNLGSVHRDVPMISDVIFICDSKPYPYFSTLKLVGFLILRFTPGLECYHFLLSWGRFLDKAASVTLEATLSVLVVNSTKV